MEAFPLDLSLVKADDGLVTRNGVVALTWSTYLVRPSPITTSTGSERRTIYPGSTMNDNIWILQISYISHMRVKSVILFGGSTVRGSHHRAGLPSTQDTTHDHHSGPDPQIDIGIRVLLQQGQIMNHQKFCKTVISNGLRWISQSKYVRHYSPIFARAWMCTSPS